ncbi:N-acetylglucosamine-specific PTS transporter subunit IIBC [Loigolactobacillus backii]|uniref:N-acetylglucosamine-specific PTS transporter subunit IIBC n=1 Tax=Loigolactobacillus backii TaxID=375175 RepID=UPI0007F17677|nr:N-acetylglucosamine-specific PTS transporter subunit IIBC [Loigolactobacillus backii]ANK60758.1 PTS N-acetylglucosamine transporter subunit IIABC [Loigolactobacillus backii]
MKTYFQRIGRSLMLPVAVLPAAAILEGIGHMLPKNWAIAQFLQVGGTAILSYLSLLFAVGLAFGMAEDKDGAAALAGVVAYIVPRYILMPKNVALLEGIKVSQVAPAFTAITDSNVFIGIVAGLVAAAMYNRFHKVKLPMAISFFSGKRLVPIMSALSMLVVTAILLFVWPVVYTALIAFSKWMVGLGPIGAGLYGFFNRLLIPTGLHQALNSVFWFNVAGINDIGNFWAGTGVKGVTGMYQAGFFPVMMFGLPAGAYAIYKNALPERKAETKSLMMAAGFASFFTGVTEPLEFSFMFVAWPLYLLHAVFTGLSLAFAAFMHWTAGFAFSAGLVDYLLSFRMPLANMPYMLLVQGVVMAVIYYFGFNFAIQRFNLMTPGREPLTDADELVDDDPDDDKFTRQAKRIYAAIGGKDNIKVIDNCTTRLRLQLQDTKKVNQPVVKAAGAAGINVLDQHNIQIVIGTEVQFVADALSQLFNTGAPMRALATSAEPVASASVTATPAAKVKSVTEDFYAVASGEAMSITKVADSTFAQKMLGDGYAIEPTSGQIVAPVDAEVTSIFPTKHAIGFKTAAGLEVLLHMGINTVELKGAPFTIAVTEGQKVKHGDLVATADLAAIKAAEKETTMMVILTNMPLVASADLKQESGQIEAGQAIAEVSTK